MNLEKPVTLSLRGVAYTLKGWAPNWWTTAHLQMSLALQGMPPTIFVKNADGKVVK